MVKHIRKSNKNVKDARFRSTTLYANKLTPVFCGAESSENDTSKDNALHFLKYQAIKPEWSADLCPDCVKLLTEG